jgi:hypothetical protein
MKKDIRYTANDEQYHAPAGKQLPWIVREIIGFCAGFTLVSGMMLLVVIGWQ